MQRHGFVLAGLLAVAAIWAFGRYDRDAVVISAADAADQQAPLLVTGLPDFSPLVAKAGPAVVAISTTQNAQEGGRFQLPPGIDPHDPFFEFFRRFQGPGPQQPQRGIGSGFVISADGYILTNAHVVQGADEVDVKLADKREFKAKVIGADSKSDVALIKIDAGGLPTLAVGDPERLRVGEWVAAIGSPFGLESTVTAGIVSAKSRAINDDAYVPFIQSDVAVNPGNSGGPLLNMRGEVVGINSQIYSRSGGYMGLSFSIPIDVAMKVESQLRTKGRVDRGLLGVMVQDVNKELADSFGLDKQEGALVSGVKDGGAADKAGIKPGDVITRVDGKPISNATDLSRLIADTPPGQKARIEVLRDGKTRELKVAVGRAPADGAVATNVEADGDQTGKLGATVRELTDAERPEGDDRGGVVVEQVGGAAAEAGLRPGDVILAVNTVPVTTPLELKKRIEAAGKSVALLIRRNDAEMFVAVPLG
jgi:serine protease Do